MEGNDLLSIKNGFRFGVGIISVILFYNVFLPKQYYDFDAFMKYITIVRVFCVAWIYIISKEHKFNIGMNCLIGFFFPGITLVVLYYEDKKNKKRKLEEKTEIES